MKTMRFSLGGTGMGGVRNENIRRTTHGRCPGGNAREARLRGVWTCPEEEEWMCR